MARITLSALLTDARGKVGTIVFSRWRSIGTVRGLVTPANPRTTLQRRTRGFMWAVSRAWARQSVPYKASFNLAASGQPWSGFNRFVDVFRDFAFGFRDYRSTTVGSHAAGVTALIVTASQPPDTPLGIDTAGFAPGAQIRVTGHAALYSVIAVDHLTNTLTISPGLSALTDAGTVVETAGPPAPDASPWTFRP